MSGNNGRHPSFFFFGHFAIDTIIRHQKKNVPTLGGSVTFGSLALRKYAPNVKISIISNIGRLNLNENFLKIFEEKDIDLQGITHFDDNNTNFVLDYSNHSRSLILQSKSPDLKFGDIPSAYLENPPDAIILAPICGEISKKYVHNICKAFPGVPIGIDAQGFLRSIDEEGTVSLVRDTKLIEEILEIIDIIGERLIFKGSEEEMKIVCGRDNFDEIMEFFDDSRFKGISIMTLGDKGSMLTKTGKPLKIIPAFKPKVLADETGAGDVYLAILMYELIKTNKDWVSIETAALKASAAASYLVEQIGPSGFKDKNKVLERVKTKNYY